MNLRQYKKRSKRARDILIADFGFNENDFWSPPKRQSGEHEMQTCEIVTGAVRGWIEWKAGTPAFLPSFTDYWGEANDPRCCVDILNEVQFWAVCGDSFARKSIAADAA